MYYGMYFCMNACTCLFACFHSLYSIVVLSQSLSPFLALSLSLCLSLSLSLSRSLSLSLSLSLCLELTIPSSVSLLHRFPLLPPHLRVELGARTSLRLRRGLLPFPVGGLPATVYGYFESEQALRIYGLGFGGILWGSMTLNYRLKVGLLGKYLITMKFGLGETAKGYCC